MSYYNLISLMPKTSFDPDAQAFITAAAITNLTQQSAINTLVVSLKGYSIWTKFKAIYPIVGGSASSHKYNLKDPRDLDAAFRLTFSTGWTHSATGMTTSGSSYANTFLNPVTNLTNYNAHSSIYCRLNGNNSGFDIGLTDSSSGYTNEFLMASRRGGNAISALYDFNSGNSQIAFIIANGKGFTSNTITSNTFQCLYRDGSILNNNTTTNTSTPASYNIYLGAINDKGTSTVEYTSNQYAFASIGNGLTSTEMSNFYTAVQAYQTTLSRQV